MNCIYYHQSYDEFSSVQNENIWILSFIKNILTNEMIFTVDKLYTAWIKDSFDLYIQDVENMEAHKCYIGPQTEGKTNHCVRQDTLTETCEDMFEDKLVCSRSLQVYPKPVTLTVIYKYPSMLLLIVIQRLEKLRWEMK